MRRLPSLLALVLAAPLALLTAPFAGLLWLLGPGEQRIELPQDSWRLSRVALAQASPVG